MFEELGLEGWTPVTASIVVGLAIGITFGLLAQRSRFCLRRGLVGDLKDRASALATWTFALAVALAGTTVLSAFGLVDFSSHRLHSGQLPVAALIIGGLMFGAGMFITRGCASRLTVLAGSGNLRAVVAILVFAVTAHATLKGVLAPVRTWLGSYTVDVGSYASLGAFTGGTLFWGSTLAIGLIAITLRNGTSLINLFYGGLIGALIPIGWLATGFILVDDFTPIPLESLAYTSSASETLFWWVAGTAIVPGFGVGLFGGTLLGSMLASTAASEFRWSGFTHDKPVARYLSGGALMGCGGVLAGGCTVGAGLSGVSILSIAALLALLSIIAGVLAAQAFANRSLSTSFPIPAE